MQEKKDAILKATSNLILQYGFHGTPISKIAKEADVGVGTIYRYFENKEILITELFLDLKRSMAEILVANLTADDPTEQSLRKIWLNTYHYCISNPTETKFLEHFQNSPLQTPEIEKQIRKFLAPIATSLELAKKKGEIKQMPLEMLAILVYDTAVALAKAHIAETIEMNKTNQELAAQACWDAVKAS
jgi:AcrR family transcriptional regulator